MFTTNSNQKSEPGPEATRDSARTSVSTSRQPVLSLRHRLTAKRSPTFSPRFNKKPRPSKLRWHGGRY